MSNIFNIRFDIAFQEKEHSKNIFEKYISILKKNKIPFSIEKWNIYQKTNKLYDIEETQYTFIIENIQLEYLFELSKILQSDIIISSCCENYEYMYTKISCDKNIKIDFVVSIDSNID